MATITNDPIDTQRLAEIARLKAMESIIEETYGDITSLAAAMCKTPTAAITIADSEQLWFLARHGMDMTNSPRAIAFCFHTIRQDDVFIIEDTLADPMFRDNPLSIQGPSVRFYAGAPLKTANGQKIGAICVIDQKKSHLSEEQVFLLKVLARLVTLQLESAISSSDLNITLSRLRGFVDHLSFGILVEDKFRKVAFVNDIFSQYFPLATGKVRGDFEQESDTIFAQIASLTRSPEEHLCRLEELVKNQVTVIGEEITLTDGRVLERGFIPTVVYQSYEGHIWIYRDVTEKKETEKFLNLQKSKLASAEKMAALGEMAAGMAHEINNSMAIIHAQSHSLLLQSKKGPVDPAFIAQSAKTIEETSERVAQIVRSLKSFAGEDINVPLVRERISAVIRNASLLCLSRFSQSGVSLDIATVSDDIIVECRPVLLTHALFNILSNALDAAFSSEEKWVRIELTESGARIKIEITDSGAGIANEIRENIMIPFFTTKEIGKGTGLGLSLSKGIIEVHRGALYLKGCVPHTCFVVDLPKEQGKA